MHPQLFHEADSRLMPDLHHPNGEGYELLGRRFAQAAFGSEGLLLAGRCPPEQSCL